MASGGHSSSRCAGLSLSRPLLLRSTSSRRTGSVVVAHGLSCSAACGIFPDQGSNPCPLHWQADSQPLRHQGSRYFFFILHVYFPLVRLWGGEEFCSLPSEMDWITEAGSRGVSILISSEAFSMAQHSLLYCVMWFCNLHIIVSIS